MPLLPALAAALLALVIAARAHADDPAGAAARAPTSGSPEAAAPPEGAVQTGRGGGSDAPATTTPSDDDRAIEKRLTGIFANVDELRDVRATVRAGVVRLRGTAAGPESKKHAAELARKTSGVVFVDNDIEEAANVAEQIEPTLSRLWSRLDEIVRRGPIYGIALATIATFALLAGVVRRWHAPFRVLIKRRIVRDIVQQVSSFALFLVGVVIALELLEATALVGAVLGAAGLVGIALGFAFRDIAENYLASLLLGVRRPFSANDHVLIEGHEGKVVRMTMRDTILMTLDGNHVRLPNALVFKAVIVNYTSNPMRRFQFAAGVGVTSDLVEAQEVGNAALRETPGVASEPAPFTWVEELGDSNVVVRVHGWVDQRAADWYKVRSEAVRRVKSAFDAAGIEMPVPIQRVQIEPLADDADRDGRRELGKVELSKTGGEVHPDDVLDRQIAREVKQDGDVDLLSDAPPG